MKRTFFLWLLLVSLIGCKVHDEDDYVFFFMRDEYREVEISTTQSVGHTSYWVVGYIASSQEELSFRFHPSSPLISATIKPTGTFAQVRKHDLTVTVDSNYTFPTGQNYGDELLEIEVEGKGGRLDKIRLNLKIVAPEQVNFGITCPSDTSLASGATVELPFALHNYSQYSHTFFCNVSGAPVNMDVFSSVVAITLEGGASAPGHITLMNNGVPGGSYNLTFIVRAEDSTADTCSFQVSVRSSGGGCISDLLGNWQVHAVFPDTVMDYNSEIVSYNPNNPVVTIRNVANNGDSVVPYINCQFNEYMTYANPGAFIHSIQAKNWNATTLEILMLRNSNGSLDSCFLHYHR